MQFYDSALGYAKQPGVLGDFSITTHFDFGWAHLDAGSLEPVLSVGGESSNPRDDPPAYAVNK